MKIPELSPPTVLLLPHPESVTLEPEFQVTLVPSFSFLGMLELGAEHYSIFYHNRLTKNTFRHQTHNVNLPCRFLASTSNIMLVAHI